MNYTYWIDKHGGSHYHKKDCVMIQDPRFPYESIIRKSPRKSDNYWGLTRIREDGKYYMPCPACFWKKRG